MSGQKNKNTDSRLGETLVDSLLDMLELFSLYIYIYICVCVCVCVCVFAYIYIYMCVCVCLCLCAHKMYSESNVFYSF